ncbi:MAG: acyl-CoA reductase [Smithellaceae bacterium]|nr:acyl-CoA reductase [Smithellaceae bacterium]
MNKRHLWRGEFISDGELENRLGSLESETSVCLAQGFDLEIALGTLDALSGKLKQQGELFYSLSEELTKTGTPIADAEALMAGFADFISRENLARKIESELKTDDPFGINRISFRDDIFEGWAPIGLLVHVAPANVPTVGVLSVIEGLLTGNVNFLKTGDPHADFSGRILKLLGDMDSTGMLRNHLYAARIPSSRQDLLKRLFNQADGISAWGGDETISAVRGLAPLHTRIIEWGHKISFVYVAGESLYNQDILEPVARDCCRIEQQACSSPQCVYVETDDWQELRAFAHRFADILESVSRQIPRVLPAMPEQADITTAVELCRLESCVGQAEVIRAADLSWQILVELESSLRPSPLYRTVWIKPLLRRDIIKTLRPMRSYLQTAGLSCGRESVAPLVHLLTAAGILRIVPPGKMGGGGYAGEPHDGEYPLVRYSRRVSFHADDKLQNIAGLNEFSKRYVPPVAEKRPVMTKEDFLGAPFDEAYAGLYFKSGGSSGKPKLSIFSYEDYHAQMAVAAEGLYAAGLDPARDRVMNVFAAGNLYGGFLSFFSILEHLQAPQFPMGMQEDLAQVAHVAIEQRVNTLVGPPGYIIKLLESNRESFIRYGGIKKIFYGGEHLSPSAENTLRNGFGIETIRSAAYGSNDAGPMGFQCAHCAGSIHHLHTKLHVLEILQLEEDRPVEGEETGRLVFTALKRKGFPLVRYEIGDTGHWVLAPCSCGRTAPRFAISGRYGDVFRVGSTPLFNYNMFVNILDGSLNYHDPVQLVIRGTQNLTLLISNNSGLDPALAKDNILGHYEEFRVYSVDKGGFGFEVRSIPDDLFIKSEHSGKVIHILTEEMES